MQRSKVSVDTGTLRVKSSLDVFKIASGLIMVVAILTSMFAVGSLGKLGLEKLMGVDNCFYTRPMVEPKNDDIDYSKQCKEETENNTRRQIADSLAILLVSIPLSVLFYKQTKK